ncbi:hypothetical protein JTB14_024416 [Gonioctena quinquepunctata]|nr:hypothetical protein JTB14_024416 [Gonioctena quinquepunctata]
MFVCMATKELVSDLSTESFLAELRRFITRRGRCSHSYCDSGTNFIGARNIFASISEAVVTKEQIQFNINCPKAPNFGGLWESGIKIKSHLYRVIGSQILTFVELYTVSVQIKADLNSMPLCQLSSDPNDLQDLTPGHFSTLEPMNSLPDPEIENINIGRLQRWKLLLHIYESFWRRWAQEYLLTLIQRSKWTSPSTPIESNT